MSSTSDYTPPKVWTWKKTTEGRFANINRPIAGPTLDKELPERQLAEVVREVGAGTE